MSSNLESEVTVRSIGSILARNLTELFPEHDLKKQPHIAVTLALQTKYRQAAYSSEMKEERDKCFERLMELMTKFCARMDEAGRWCDFIDPSGSQPVRS